MNLRFHHVAIFGKTHSTMTSPMRAMARKGLEDITHFLHGHGCDVVFDSQTATHFGFANIHTADLATIGATCDLGLVIGGDGTMLGVGRQLARYGIPLIGINQGRLGFITDVSLEGFADILTPMLGGQYQEDSRPLIQGRVMRDQRCVFEALALNDIVVNRGGTAGMVELRVEVDGHFVANQRADGLIVASPTGSTAYALSAGGPLMHPLIPGWIMVPIAPHMLSNRPIVISDRSEISVEIVSGRDASANFDMQSLASLLIGDRILVQRSRHSIRFLHPSGWNYFDTLRAKLHWNEGVNLS
jgi:NAD+ kinase